MMKNSFTTLRLLFIAICILFSIAYASVLNSDSLFTNVILGSTAGLAFGLGIVVIDVLLANRCKLRTFNTLLLGLFLGYLFGEMLIVVLNTILGLTGSFIAYETLILVKGAIFLGSLYIGMILTARANEELQFSIPFIRFKPSTPLKKDVLIDWSILMDSRIIDIASSGLLDDQLIVPKFMLTELYLMLENEDETIKNKARRCLDVFKKIETITTLNLRYSDLDFPEVVDSASKLIQLARQVEANIITADVARLQQYAIEGIRIINIHMLSNVLKPMVTGEYITIKVQRYGKEPRQGVGYLDDGTMVVVNGGAEYLGEMIKAQVLSVKHTSSGRMVFCNAAEESVLLDPSNANGDLLNANKNYFAL